MRARILYASKDRVKQDAITYEELADPKWKGKICIRSGQHIYNNALFAAYVAKHGIPSRSPGPTPRASFCRLSRAAAHM
jgi:ABC-type Fe3+ transport system substrate-binding protein